MQVIPEAGTRGKHQRHNNLPLHPHERWPGRQDGLLCWHDTYTTDRCCVTGRGRRPLGAVTPGDAFYPSFFYSETAQGQNRAALQPASLGEGHHFAITDHEVVEHPNLE